MRLPYVPADLSGDVLEGDSVFYACKEKNSTLNDGSGMGIYEAKCTNGTLEPQTWPNCETMVSIKLQVFISVVFFNQQYILHLDSLCCFPNN